MTTPTTRSPKPKRRTKLHPSRRAMFVMTVFFVSGTQGLLAATISLSDVDPVLGFVVATVSATCGITLVFAAGLQS